MTKKEAKQSLEKGLAEIDMEISETQNLFCGLSSQISAKERQGLIKTLNAKYEKELEDLNATK